jgi:hypothetical protein
MYTHIRNSCVFSTEGQLICKALDPFLFFRTLSPLLAFLTRRKFINVILIFGLFTCPKSYFWRTNDFCLQVKVHHFFIVSWCLVAHLRNDEIARLFFLFLSLNLFPGWIHLSGRLAFLFSRKMISVFFFNVNRLASLLDRQLFSIYQGNSNQSQDLMT